MANDLNDTLIFVKVVEQGSFTAAARLLGQPKTTVSRKVQELEERLGARLLHRTTRRLGLTEAGSVYYEHCQRIARELEQAESAVSQLQSGPRGWLRFTVPYSVGITWSRRCWASSRRSTRKSAWTCTWATRCWT